MKPRTILGSFGFVATLVLAGVMIYLDRMDVAMIGLISLMFAGSGLLIAPEDFKNFKFWRREPR